MSSINDPIVAAIAATGCYVGRSVIDAALVIALRARSDLLQQQGAFNAARVGRARAAVNAPQLRGDAIAWLDQGTPDPAEAAAMRAVDALRMALNAALFIGAMDTEFHYARFPQGAFYKTHLDRFGDSDVRVVSLVFYLNADWGPDDGGELVIYDQARQAIARVAPRCGTMVAFLSARFPHEVLPATRPRLALTGWMRRRALQGQ